MLKISFNTFASSLFSLKLMEFFGEINSLKTGIITSDAITTVSPSYSKEILLEYGNQLQDVIKERKKDLYNIKWS